MTSPEGPTTCPVCQADVPASQVRAQGAQAEATCSACGFAWSFDAPDFATRARDAALTEAASTEDDRPPPGIEVRETEAGLTLRRRWFTFTYALLTATPLIVIPLLVHLIGQLGDHAARGSITFAIAILLFSIAAVVLAGYVGLTGCINRTTIHVDRAQLRVEHGPLPAFWVKPRHVESADVKQLFVRTVVHRSTRRAISAWVEHRLCAALRDGSEITLADRIEQPSQALCMERLIEAHLGIADDRAYDG